MSPGMTRREFLKTPAAAHLAAQAGRAGRPASLRSAGRNLLDPFDYQGVRLGQSRWEAQYRSARAFYLGVSDDDILHGFRVAAGHPAPGRPLGGWCQSDSYTVFGQWLSGMSRMFRATGDDALREKAVRLFWEWARTIGPDGNAGDARLGHYRFDKLVCGLVDLAVYAEHRDAVTVLEKIADVASGTLSRENRLADPKHNQGYYGVPQEWYTLAENLFRAYRLTGNPKFRTFAEAWLYPVYWNKFAATAAPTDAHGVHAYSHVNTFSSAAMAYDVSGDPTYLRIIRNAYDYLQQTQCYATGGYGPNERFMAPDGSLGRALETRADTAEIVCGSWAGFKLAGYLMRFTGEARYGDWIERLLYNGVGAALPLEPGGRNFYYADYRLGGGMKVYNWDAFTCCSGTYIQNLAAYHDLIYFRDGDGLFVNLYLPSEVSWPGPSGEVKLTQETAYPDAETTTLALEMRAPASFRLRFRVPGWARDVSLKLNGTAVAVEAEPGNWAALSRTWVNGDRVEIRIPLRLRMEPVDPQHPDRVAVVRGPVVLVLEGAYHDPYFRLPEREEDLETWLVPEPWVKSTAILSPVDPSPGAAPTVFRVAPPDGSPVRLKFRPFYDLGEEYPYFMYFDRKALPWRLW